MQPRKISKISPTEIEIEWNPAHKGIFTLKQLRDLCPCAGCQGEDLLLYHVPASPKSDSPEQYKLTGIDQVGSYAVQLSWGDGHNAGIYTWEYLMNTCPCRECSAGRKEPAKNS